jgi:Divergent InlB B-repeat domain
VVVAAVGVAAAGLVLAARRGPSGKVELRVVVSGPAEVRIEPGDRSCRTRCRFRLERGKRVSVTADPAEGARFLRWQGACAGSRCSFPIDRAGTVVARFAGDAGLQSWSAFTDCRPVKTTIAEVLGMRVGRGGAPLEAGGSFRPHLRGPRQQHLLRPPCAIRGTSTFVELDGLAISGPVLRAADGDVVTHVIDPQGRQPNPYLRTLRLEIDATWLRAGAAIRDFPSQPARIDVQGFVYWNTGHGLAEPPEPSGWELHPVSSWLPAAG